MNSIVKKYGKKTYEKYDKNGGEKDNKDLEKLHKIMLYNKI